MLYEVITQRGGVVAHQVAAAARCEAIDQGVGARHHRRLQLQDLSSDIGLSRIAPKKTARLYKWRDRNNFV